MTMRSREFLGVKLVPMGSRVRRAVTVFEGQNYVYALLPSGSVAVNSRDIFLDRFDRWTYLRASVARDLAKIGAVTDEVAAKFISDEESDPARKEARRIADDLEANLSGLGLKLTRAQQRAIAKLTK
ncbi:hypothetical protein RPPS3_25500 [Rhodopseudomonas palustris]|uniref:hypothetical protein n=1 Tax=Rhodopseudomonas palustris TaxID=1076 RepID=UPI000D226172|nr:hypothetical protein [Rhodopseudomonas palustris]AVT76613.1 hypothetical protein RPPS3_25500 [Rhodopseudomonas palustris]